MLKPACKKRIATHLFEQFKLSERCAAGWLAGWLAGISRTTFRYAYKQKHTYRLFTEEGLQVRTKKRKKLQRPRLPMALPNRANQCWSMDFVADQLSSGRRFRVLNIADDFTREMVGQLVSVSINGAMVARFLNQIMELRGKPDSVV